MCALSIGVASSERLVVVVHEFEATLAREMQYGVVALFDAVYPVCALFYHMPCAMNIKLLN